MLGLCPLQTILLLSVLKSLHVITGKGNDPSDAECEQMTIEAYKLAGRKLHERITQSEFTGFVMKKVDGNCDDVEALMQSFGLVAVRVGTRMLPGRLSTRIRSRVRARVPQKSPKEQPEPSMASVSPETEVRLAPSANDTTPLGLPRRASCWIQIPPVPAPVETEPPLEDLGEQTSVGALDTLSG